MRSSTNRTFTQLQFVGRITGTIAKTEQEVFFTSTQRTDTVCTTWCIRERYRKHLHFQCHLAQSFYRTIFSSKARNIETVVSMQVSSFHSDYFSQHDIRSTRSFQHFQVFSFYRSDRDRQTVGYSFLQLFGISTDFNLSRLCFS